VRAGHQIRVAELLHGDELGVAVVLVVVINLCLQIGAGYLLFDYAMRKPTPRSRMIALTCSFIGIVLIAISLVMYYAFVTVQMDSVTQGGIGGALGSAALSANLGGIGIAPGYIICWTGLFGQLIAVALFEFTRNASAEEAYEERKFEEEFAAQYGNQGVYGSFPQQAAMPVQMVQPFGGTGHTAMPMPMQGASAGFGLPQAQPWQAGQYHAAY